MKTYEVRYLGNAEQGFGLDDLPVYRVEASNPIEAIKNFNEMVETDVGGYDPQEQYKVTEIVEATSLYFEAQEYGNLHQIDSPEAE